jgi:hypothetical protein
MIIEFLLMVLLFVGVYGLIDITKQINRLPDDEN